MRYRLEYFMPLNLCMIVELVLLATYIDTRQQASTLGGRGKPYFIKLVLLKARCHIIPHIQPLAESACCNQ